LHTANFVCLANSRKHKGRCVAGKALHNGTFTKWIRPITTHPSEELQAKEHRLQTGQDAAILDLINITLIEPRGKLHQQENWLMDVSVPLKKVGTVTVEEVSQVIDSPPSLWGVGFSSKNSINDFVPASEIQKFDCSLFLVEIDNLIVQIVEETYPYVRKVMAGTFSYKGNTYKLKITDPVFENDFGARPVGDYEIEKTLLTISLGENFKDNFYKLIAGIIPITYGKKWSS
jgi:hypothetical protein